MTVIWKLLGAAAAVAGLAPYKVSKDEETGEVKAKALLWKASYSPANEEKGKTVDVHFGLNIPGKEKEDETHIYTDDVTVSYAAEEKAEEAAEAAEKKVEKAAETVAEKVEGAAEAVEEKAEEIADAAEAAVEKVEETVAEAVEEKAEEAAEAAEEKVEDAHAEAEKPAEE